jgi:hypothetical protein
MFHQLSCQLGNLPIALHCIFPQGSVAFSKLANFPAFIDLADVDDERISGTFYPDGFTLYNSKTDADGEDFFFRTVYQYKEIPLLKKWLQQLNLSMPKEVYGSV